MRRPFVIAVSGIVGSGKSTALKQVLDVLHAEGVPAAAWQFQRLPCFTFRPASARSAGAERQGDDPDPPASTQPQRGRGYRRKSLTAVVTLGYLARMAAFRVYRRWPRKETWVVSNRYFYDNLVHYEVGGGAAPLFRRLLAASIPRPDLAIVLTARQATLAARRPNYASEYLSAVAEGYEQLQVLFPDIQEFRTDEGEDSLRRIRELVRSRLEEARGTRVPKDGRTAPPQRG